DGNNAKPAMRRKEIWFSSGPSTAAWEKRFLIIIRSLLLEGIPVKINSLGFGQTRRIAGNDRADEHAPITSSLVNEFARTAVISPLFSCVSHYQLHRNRESRRPNSSCQVGQIFPNSAHMKTTTLRSRNSVNRSSVPAF